jgi:capsular polysaccharide biosynthesis protein
VELNEAVRRIFGQHWPLIVFCVGLSLLGVNLVGLHRGEGKSYTASTRVVLDTQDPKSQSESAAIADTARAIATSPSQVASALRRARATDRDPVKIAKNSVSVQALGASGILQVSITDHSPRIAAAIANALAAGLIRVRLDVTGGQARETLAALDTRIDDINQKIARLDANAATLLLRVRNASSPARADAAQVKRGENTRARDFLAQERAVRESERVNLVSTLALRPKPSIISPASVPQRADASGALLDTVLAVLLGLVLGVGLAGLIETLRPTLVGGDALARELDLPLLGRLQSDPAAGEPLEDVGDLAARVRMSAEAAHVRSVTLVAAGQQVDVGRLAERLEIGAQPFDNAAPQGDTERLLRRETLAAARRERLVTRAEAVAPQAVSVHAFGPDNALSNAGATGLVLVAPATVKKADLDDTIHLLRISPAPLLGLITYTTASRWGGRRPERRNAA